MNELYALPFRQANVCKKCGYGISTWHKPISVFMYIDTSVCISNNATLLFEFERGRHFRKKTRSMIFFPGCIGMRVWCDVDVFWVLSGFWCGWWVVAHLFPSVTTTTVLWRIYGLTASRFGVLSILHKSMDFLVFWFVIQNVCPYFSLSHEENNDGRWHIPFENQN